MQRARHCLSLAAVAALTCGLGGNLPADSALAESSLSAANRIVAVYRVDLAGFNLGDFRVTTTSAATTTRCAAKAGSRSFEGPHL